MVEQSEFEVRAPTRAELGAAARAIRGARGWTQETLAELAGVAVRTVQRLEDGRGASPDTLRAIARAIEADDLDLFLRPVAILTPAALRKRAEAFERDYLMLPATIVTSGRAVEELVSSVNALCCDDAEIDEDSDRHTAATLSDHLTDYLDAKGWVRHEDRLAMTRVIEGLVAELRAAGWSIVTAVRQAVLKSENPAAPMTPMPIDIGYLKLVPRGREPATIAVPRCSRFNW